MQNTTCAFGKICMFQNHENMKIVACRDCGIGIHHLCMSQAPEMVGIEEEHGLLYICRTCFRNLPTTNQIKQTTNNFSSRREKKKKHFKDFEY